MPSAKGQSSWLSFFPPWFMPAWYSLLSHGVKLGKWWEPSGRTPRSLRLRPKGGHGGLVAKPCPTLCNPKASQVPLSMGFPRQEYWSGLPFPPPGDLPDPGIKPTPLASPALEADSLPLRHLGSPWLVGASISTSAFTHRSPLCLC